MIPRTFLYSALLLSINSLDLIQFPQKLIFLAVLFVAVMIFSLFDRPGWNDLIALIILLLSSLFAFINLFHFMPLLQLLVLISVFVQAVFQQQEDLGGILLFSGIILSFASYSLTLGSLHLDYSVLGYGLVFFSFLFMAKNQGLIFVQVMIILLLVVSFSSSSVFYDFIQYLVYLSLVVLLLFKQDPQSHKLALIFFMLLSPLMLLSMIMTQLGSGMWSALLELSLIVAKSSVLLGIYLNRKKGSGFTLFNLRD